MEKINVIETMQIAASLFAIHVMRKLATGDAGSLSVSLSKKIHVMSKKV